MHFATCGFIKLKKKNLCSTELVNIGTVILVWACWHFILVVRLVLKIFDLKYIVPSQSKTKKMSRHSHLFIVSSF